MLEAIKKINLATQSTVYVVTTASGDQRGGCLASFVTQASLDPVTYLVLLSHRTHTYGLVEESRACALHWLDQGQHDLARHFATKTGFEIDKLEGLGYRAGATGSPIIEEVPAYVELEFHGSLDCVDHTAFLGYPLEAELRWEFQPYTVQDVYRAGINAAR